MLRWFTVFDIILKDIFPEEFWIYEQRLKIEFQKNWQLFYFDYYTTVSAIYVRLADP